MFYNVPNVMARVKGRKLDDLWAQETPAPHDRYSALSLRMCDLSAAPNTAATAAAKPHTAAQQHMRTVLNALTTTSDVTPLQQHPTVVLTEVFRRVPAAVGTSEHVTPTQTCDRPLTVAFFMRDQVRLSSTHTSRPPGSSQTPARAEGRWRSMECDGGAADGTHIYVQVRNRWGRRCSVGS